MVKLRDKLGSFNFYSLLLGLCIVCNFFCFCFKDMNFKIRDCYIYFEFYLFCFVMVMFYKNMLVLMEFSLMVLGLFFMIDKL